MTKEITKPANHQMESFNVQSVLITRVSNGFIVEVDPINRNNSFPTANASEEVKVFETKDGLNEFINENM